MAESFEEIAEVEEEHEKRYRKLLENVRNGTVFKRDEEVEWHCLNCGYIHHGKEAPEVCPACKHPQAYYELHVPNYKNQQDQSFYSFISLRIESKRVARARKRSYKE